MTYVQRHARATIAARAKRGRCVLYADWRCTVVAVERACESVEKLLANIVADAPMGRVDVDVLCVASVRVRSAFCVGNHAADRCQQVILWVAWLRKGFCTTRQGW